MSFWTAAVVIAAIIGFVEIYKARHGVVKDWKGNESIAQRDDPETRREVEEMEARIVRYAHTGATDVQKLFHRYAAIQKRRDVRRYYRFGRRNSIRCYCKIFHLKRVSVNVLQ